MPRARLPRVRLFHWNAEDAKLLIARLKEAGYAVIYSERTQSPSVVQIKKEAPLAIVIDLTKLPSHGRYVGAWVRGSKRTREIPLVFVGGESEKVARLQAEIPDAVYTTHAKLAQVLKKVKPPKDPMVPKQMMAPDPGRTTAQKLGITKPMRVGVIDAPIGYERVIGPLPDGAELEEDPRSPGVVTLWFVHDAAEFEAALPSRRALAAKTRLWIAWQKGRKDGLNGNFIRETAIALGLVDYKICSLDAQWSAMVFAVKKG